MSPNELTRISKFLSKHLRHEPESLGLELAPGGWVEVDKLLAACASKRVALSRSQLEEVVATSDKKRFAFDDTGARIRANQGHSVEVDLQLDPQTPPDILFHGTAKHTIASILNDGLQRMSRLHVHLSLDVATARKVGARHGQPVILEIDAAAMHAAGHVFYRSANGVWLVDEVPAAFLRVAT
jgi:putative RNA 2'-phosphotransferase